ncbi:MAG: hypothetical protein IKK29_05895 [Christensenellaceae bacterium]|nr:hypothetical protein [Christensenellaceae bacterium]
MADDFGMGYALGQDSGGGNGMFGGDGWLGLILFAMIFGNNGWGGGFGGGNGALTRAELHDGFAINDIQGGIRDLSSSLASCCCENREAIAQVRYDMATQACETRRAIEDSTREILGFMTQHEINDLRLENQTLKFAASQQAQNAFITANQEAQTAELIRRLGKDYPVPAYVVPNPNCCYNGTAGYGYGYGSSCNGGCGCGW